jgi:hypothetical protein
VSRRSRLDRHLRSRSQFSRLHGGPAQRPRLLTRKSPTGGPAQRPRLLTREAKQKGWWHPYGLSNAGYVALETDAAIVYEYQLGHVPGLLQTAEYARAVFRGTPPPRSEAEIDRIAQVRLLPPAQAH